MTKFKNTVIFVLSIMMAFGTGFIIPIIWMLKLYVEMKERTRERRKVSYRSYHDR